MATRVGGFTVDYTCGCCGEGAWLLVGDCQSLTGTATLCGFSGYSSDASPYDPAAPGVWEGQYRKWGDKAIEVDYNYADTITVYDSACGGSVFSTENRYRNVSGAGTQTLACAGCTPSGDLTIDASTGPESPIPLDCPDTAASIFLTRTSNPSLTGSSATIAGYLALTTVSGTYARTLTSEALTVNGTDTGCALNQGSELTVAYEGSSALSDEQYFYDALAELAAGGSPDVVAGEECCTTLTEADLTTPESTAPITMSGTAVRVPITIMGCSPVGIVMSVYITLTQGENTYEVEIGIPCLVPTMVYIPLAAPGDDPICFVRASLEPTV